MVVLSLTVRLDNRNLLTPFRVVDPQMAPPEEQQWIVGDCGRVPQEHLHAPATSCRTKKHSVLRLAKLEVHSPELVSSQKGGRLVFSDREDCPVIRAFFGSI